jgi:hypothetical protein
MGFCALSTNLSVYLEKRQDGGYLGRLGKLLFTQFFKNEIFSKISSTFAQVQNTEKQGALF